MSPFGEHLGADEVNGSYQEIGFILFQCNNTS